MVRLSLVFLFFQISSVLGCLWDTDTIRDELKSKASVYDLVMGQVPHHGEAYYKKRVGQLELIEQPTFEQRQDLAVAYIRLEAMDKAESLLHEMYREFPNTYTVNSNLGVFYKKNGDFEKSYEFMKRALQIKPEGHMKLGDWYLKRIDYDRKNTAILFKDRNFLGEKYEDTKLGYAMEKKWTPERKKRALMLKRLILNDSHFADGYLVLGDLFWEAGDLHIAFRAYARAKKLNHRNMEAVHERLDAVIHHWKARPYSEKYRIKEIAGLREKHIKALDIEFDGAQRWLDEFQKTEIKLLEEGEFPSFHETRAVMTFPNYYPREE